ncbi:MAG: hypothetical protein SGBAC_011624 [Bacillariaceae sp.]
MLFQQEASDVYHHPVSKQQKHSLEDEDEPEVDSSDQSTASVTSSVESELESVNAVLDLKKPVTTPAAAMAIAATAAATTATATTTSNNNSNNNSNSSSEESFESLRYTYLMVILAIMLADGLQGTHLYVLYEGYGFSVAPLYALGFLTGAVTTPLTGSLVDKFGRKWSAIIYCILEITINQLEQYPYLSGLIISRMVGGITTNLLSTVFEAWLDTEYRRRGLPEDKYEIIMRDSVIISNLAAIASGYLAHVLAESYGPVGPFKGAVTCTTLALVVVATLWTENYGNSNDDLPVDEHDNDHDNDHDEHEHDNVHKEPSSTKPEEKSIRDYVQETVAVFRNDSKVLRVGIIQGFTVGCLQIFIFLWSPTLAEFAKTSNFSTALDSAGQPAYGLIFGAYMAAGVLGGLLSPFFRKAISSLLTPMSSEAALNEVVLTEDGEEEHVRPMAVEFMASLGYIICACLLFVPVVMDPQNERSFQIALAAFLVYEFLVGVIMPCEGIIRSLYLPKECRASIMALPRMIVNIQVSLAVILTTKVTHQSAFTVIALLMGAAACLQMSLISTQEWESLFAKAEHGRRKSMEMMRRSSSLLSSSTNRFSSKELLEEEQDLDTCIATTTTTTTTTKVKDE